MKARLALGFPYLCALFVVALIVWGNSRTDVISAQTPDRHAAAPQAKSGTHVDLVCQMEVGTQIALKLGTTPYYFCTEHCRELFGANLEQYLTEVCLVCRAEKQFTPVAQAPAFEAVWQGKTYRFCSTEHREAFRGDPAGYFMHSMWGIPTWLYYCSIALILILSFGIIEWRSKRTEGTQSSALDARIDLMSVGWLKRLLTSPLTRFAAQLVVVAFFVMIVAAGLFGNQLPSKNIAPILTWTVWWGGLIWLVLYAGKAWCYVCPWDAVSDWAEGVRLWGKKKRGQSLRLAWPKFMRTIWPATLLFVALTWFDLGFGVTMKPRATAYLALAMVAFAFVSAFIFDRKSFCRYGCLVGRISGLYALFSPIEVRSSRREACRTCPTHSCYKGNDRGEACPTFQNLATMRQSTYCISCMECLKACERQNVAVNLRPWGADLAGNRRVRSDEAYLAILMLSLTGFHGLTMTPAWRSVVAWIESSTGVGTTASFTVGMIAIMVAPGLLYALLVALSRWWARAETVGYRTYFISYAYALLPIALFYHLAHNSEHLLMEGQKVVALLSDPFGYEWNLFGTRDWVLAPLVNLPTLWIVQVFFVMIGHVFSLWVARRTAGTLFGDERTALRSQIPMLAAMILFSLMSLWLLKQPMEMRTSAM